jgi:hypothetical protein
MRFFTRARRILAQPRLDLGAALGLLVLFLELALRHALAPEPGHALIGGIADREKGIDREHATKQLHRKGE